MFTITQIFSITFITQDDRRVAIQEVLTSQWMKAEVAERAEQLVSPTEGGVGEGYGEGVASPVEQEKQGICIDDTSSLPVEVIYTTFLTDIALHSPSGHSSTRAGS